MSLFGSREWWAVRVGDREEFDQRSLCVANIDNEPSGEVKLITGSLQGVLRVHQPRGREHKAEDCLLEVQLEAGILQLEAGRFAGGGQALCLAVLFPRKLAVLRFEAVGSSYLQVTRLYEHYLEHTAANMTVGTFGGGTSGLDSICVQSYDGQLAFFEGETASFARFLPNFLVPGPLCYCPSTDSFVTCNAAFELESYRYGSLAAAAGGRDLGDAASVGNGGGAKRVAPEWRLILGEAAVDICLLRVTPPPLPSAPATGVGTISSAAATPAGSRRNLGAAVAATGATGRPAAPRQELLVVCEHSLFVVAAASGQLLLQRRLEYHPACCWPYPAPAAAAGAAPGGDNLLVATHTRALLVYQGAALAWAARLELQPVALRVAALGGVEGMIVALDDAGRLAVFYLGTDPPSAAVAPACEARPLDYAALDAEHRRLLAQIEAAGGAGAGLDSAAAAAADAAAAASASRLVIKAQVPSRLDALSTGAGGSGGLDVTRQVTVRLLLVPAGNEALKDVQLSVSAPEPAVVLDPSLTLNSVSGGSGGGQAASVCLAFSWEAREGGDAVPASNIARVVATWRQPGSDAPCSSSLEFALPLALFCSAAAPAKTAAFKLTLDTNRAPPHMQLLFHDLVAQVSPAQAEDLARMSGANALGLQFGGASGPLVSILVSKAGGRYRLQSDCFPALWLATQELTQRLALHYRAADSKPGAPPPPAEGQLVVSLQEPLPLQDVYDLIEAHFAARAADRALAARLEDRAQQFRSVQKRLLVRYKDKTPAPLAELDTLMGETYDQLISLADEREAAQSAARSAARALGGGLRLLVQLAAVKLGLGEADAAALREAVHPEVLEDAGAEVGWEEEAEASLTHLLRTSLARSSKEAAVSVPPLAAAKDTQRLRKHLGLVLERLGKGARLVAPPDGVPPGRSVAAVAAPQQQG